MDGWDAPQTTGIILSVWFIWEGFLFFHICIITLAFESKYSYVVMRYGKYNYELPVQSVKKCDWLIKR